MKVDTRSRLAGRIIGRLFPLLWPGLHVVVNEAQNVYVAITTWTFGTITPLSRRDEWHQAGGCCADQEEQRNSGEHPRIGDARGRPVAKCLFEREIQQEANDSAAKN